MPTTIYVGGLTGAKKQHSFGRAEQFIFFFVDRVCINNPYFPPAAASNAIIPV